MEMLRILKYTSLLAFILSCDAKVKEYKLLYKNGEVKVLGYYLDGKAHGYWQGYYPNGYLRTSGEYYNGELVGYWAWYYEDGSVFRDTTYEYPEFYE